MFANPHTNKIRVTLEWASQKRMLFKTRFPSNKIATHYILSSNGGVSEINSPPFAEPLPVNDNPRAYLLQNELIPHSVTISPSKKSLFHVKPTFKKTMKKRLFHFSKSYQKYELELLGHLCFISLRFYNWCFIRCCFGGVSKRIRVSG